MVQYFVGTSGWHYDDWKGRFYPQEIAKAGWLDFYSRHFNSVELNNSFYRLPSAAALVNWRDLSPQGFIFSVKVSRFITHIKRLKSIGEALHTFLTRVDLLQDKLGPLLYQLPPNMKRNESNESNLVSFLEVLPKNYKHVIEFRHSSWIDDVIFDLLRKHKIGLCVFNLPDFTCPLEATTDFAYIRLHGSQLLYSSRYSDEELRQWSTRISRIKSKLASIYIYFNNDIAGYAVDNAVTLGKMLNAE